MLTLDRAGIIVDAALAEGVALGARPLSVAVVDAHGHLKALKHQDGPGTLRSDIAIAKARAAVEGRDLGAPGGAAVLGESGEVIGAVGVSGHEKLDEAAARAGIAAAGYRAGVGEDGPGAPPHMSATDGKRNSNFRR